MSFAAKVNEMRERRMLQFYNEGRYFFINAVKAYLVNLKSYSGFTRMTQIDFYRKAL
jgi:hypothetical protein